MPIIHQLVYNPPERIIFKSLVVLAKITIPVSGENSSFQKNLFPLPEDEDTFPMTENSVNFALALLDPQHSNKLSRDREVFRALIELHANNLMLVVDFSRVIAYMCRLQPPEFVFVSFAVELETFAKRAMQDQKLLSRDLQFISSLIAQMCHALLNAKEAKPLRDALKDCIRQEETQQDQKRARLFHILLHAFSHNLVASTSLCLWGGAFRTSNEFLKNINPLDIHLMFLLELDKLVEMLERPLFRHLHVRMLEHSDKNPLAEGSGNMLFQTLRSLLMCIPQSTCFNVLRDRLVSTSRFRQSALVLPAAQQQHPSSEILPPQTEMFVNRVLSVRVLHCNALWETIRAESLEETLLLQATSAAEEKEEYTKELGDDRREWLGYESKEQEVSKKEDFQREILSRGKQEPTIEEVAYKNFESLSPQNGGRVKKLLPNDEPATAVADQEEEEASWKEYWAQGEQTET